MKDLLRKVQRNQESGFTLIELLVVIVIIGVLAAIALPIFMNQQKAAINATVKSDARATVQSVQTYLITNPKATVLTNHTDSNRVDRPLLVQSTTNNHISVQGSADDWMVIVKDEARTYTCIFRSSTWATVCQDG